jgi:hypothetical protein
MALIMARNKRSSQGSGRVTGAASPLSGALRDELVEAIVHHLKPWKNHKSRDTVTAAVNLILDFLLGLVPSNKKNFDRRAIRKHAKKLDRALSKVEELLASSPGLLDWVLFDPRPVLQAGDYEYPEIRFHREIRARAIAFGAELKRLRDVCARDYGDHPNYDHAKNQSAWFSWALMERHSNRKITGTENQAFRTIAGLVYEVLSSQQNADLKRACDTMLRNIRSTAH